MVCTLHFCHILVISITVMPRKWTTFEHWSYIISILTSCSFSFLLVHKNHQNWGMKVPSCFIWYEVCILFVHNTQITSQSPVYVVNSHFSNLPSWIIFTISKSFSMRYCMTVYLKGLEKYDRSKLKLLNSLNKSKTFNFDLSYS